MTDFAANNGDYAQPNLQPDAQTCLLLNMAEDIEPRCPHGCRKKKPMWWLDDKWYCPTCGDEWNPDEPSGQHDG